MNRDEEFTHLREKMFYSNDIKSKVYQPAFFPELLKNFKKKWGRDFTKNHVDLLVGGPPCQGYSAIGIRRSYSVDKKQLPSNHLYEDMAIFIRKLTPKVFLFENVAGILTAKWTSKGKKGEIFKDIYKTFNSLKGYQVRWSLLHAKNYGVPQNRPRVILIGIREDILKKSSVSSVSNNPISDSALDCGFLPLGKEKAPDLCEVLEDLIDKNYKNELRTTKYPHTAQTNFQKEIRKKPNNRVSKKGEKLTEHEYSST